MVVWGFPCESRTLSGIEHEILDPKRPGIFFGGDKLNFSEATVKSGRNERAKKNQRSSKNAPCVATWFTTHDNDQQVARYCWRLDVSVV